MTIWGPHDVNSDVGAAANAIGVVVSIGYFNRIKISLRRSGPGMKGGS